MPISFHNCFFWRLTIGGFCGRLSFISIQIFSIIGLAFLFFRLKKHIKRHKSGNCDSKQTPLDNILKCTYSLLKTIALKARA
nr:hypothetical protein [uncultured bacterium]